MEYGVGLAYNGGNSSTIVFTSAGNSIFASFTVSYSGVNLNSGEELLAGVVVPPQDNVAYGWIDNSAPVSCQQTGITGPQVEDQFTEEAACILQLSNSQGSETLTFGLGAGSMSANPPLSVGNYSFVAIADLVHTSSDCSNNDSVCIDASSGNQGAFSISIVNEATLTVDTPSQVPVTLDGVQQGGGSLSWQLPPLQSSDGDEYSISVPSIVQTNSTNSTSRLRFSNWSGNVQVGGCTLNYCDFALVSDVSLQASYVTQYYVSTTSDSTLQSGWYDSGTVVQFSVNQTQEQNGLRVFDGWYSNGQLISKSPNASLTINGPVTLTATWTNPLGASSNDLFLLVPVIIALIACGAFLLNRKRRGSSKPRSKASQHAGKQGVVAQTIDTSQTGSKTTAAPSKTTMFCRQCGAKIPRDSRFCKECATKVVE